MSFIGIIKVSWGYGETAVKTCHTVYALGVTLLEMALSRRLVLSGAVAFVLIVIIMLVYSHYWIHRQKNIEWPSYIYIDDEDTAPTTIVSEEYELAYKLARDD